MRRQAAFATILVTVAATLLATTPAPPAEAAIDRLAGADRFETGVQVSRAMPTTTNRPVYLASGLAFPDALAAGPVAAAEGGRLLLVLPWGIPDAVEQEIQRLRPSEIVLVGAEPALSTVVWDQARELMLGVTGSPDRVTRIGGADRVETSMLLFDRMMANPSTRPTQLWVVSGANFPDALSAGAVAARQRHAVVLTTGMTPAFQQQLAARLGGIQRVNIAGSTVVIGDDVVAFTSARVPTNRYAGADRFLTSVVINQAFTTSASSSRMIVASGQNFPDGLVASVLAGTLGQPLYLVPMACVLDDAVARDAARLGVRDTTVVGGTPAVSAASSRLERCVDVGAAQGEVIAIVNAHRANVGLPPLTAHGGLMGMAQRWSGQMAAAQSMVHSSTFCNETFAMGFRRCAENIARTGSPSAGGVMNAWMNSAAHRAAILNPNLTHIGVGLAQGGDGRWYWTQNFGGS